VNKNEVASQCEWPSPSHYQRTVRFCQYDWHSTWIFKENTQRWDSGLPAPSFRRAVKYHWSCKSSPMVEIPNECSRAHGRTWKPPSWSICLVGWGKKQHAINPISELVYSMEIASDMHVPLLFQYTAEGVSIKNLWGWAKHTCIATVKARWSG